MIAETPPRSPGAPVHSQNQAHSILIDHRRTLRPHRPDQIEPAFELLTELPRARILNATAFKWHALQAGDAETRLSGTKQAEAIPGGADRRVPLRYRKDTCSAPRIGSAAFCQSGHRVNNGSAVPGAALRRAAQARARPAHVSTARENP